MNDKVLQALLKMMDRCGNSAASRLSAIQGFIIDAIEHLTPAQIQEIRDKVIPTLEVEAQQHSERGRKFGKRTAKLKAKRTYDHPGYCEDLLPCQCATCGHTLSGRGFRYHAHDGKWYYYHPELACFPKEHDQAMRNNGKWLQSLTEIN